VATRDCGFSRWGPRVELESRKGGAIAKLGRVGHEFADDRILMNIVPVMNEILSIANPMIGESTLPHVRFSPDEGAERVRVAALD
jgi:hypothetical protein